jgi:hypothetical protein
MQWFKIFPVAFLALILSACGEGGDANIEAATPTTTKDPVTTGDSVEAVSGDPSYFIYQGATPEWISIKGTGGLNREGSATVTFKLVDDNGEAVVSQPVNFEFSGPDGAFIAVESDISDSDGLVSTLIKAGSAAGPATVKVISVNEPTIFNTSTGLYISTGYPDQDSFSIGVNNSSPAGLDHNDATVAVTVNFADGHGNNPIPDGTAVTFRAEAGRIEDTTSTVGSCTTLKSSCVMTWTSIGDMPIDGKVTILAFALGVESFKDVNPSDGTYNEGEAFTDNAEVFFDENYDGAYNEGEWINDVDDANGLKDQAYSYGDGNYTGMQCEDNVYYCDQRLIYIYKQIQITASGDAQQCVFKDSAGNILSSVDLTANSSVAVTVEVFDRNNNTPPKGTEISASATNGAINGEALWTVPNWVDGAYTFEVDVVREASDNSIASGDLVIKSLAPSPSELDTKCYLSITD